MKLTISRNRPYVFMDDPSSAELGSLKKSLLSALDKATSYEVADHEQTDAWKSGQWDGWQHLLKQAKNGSWFFPVGLMPTVMDIIHAYGLTTEIIDQRAKPAGEIKYKWETDKKLRPYQAKASADALAAMSGGTGTILNMPTGGGKTLTCMNIIRKLGVRTLITVHTEELMNQWEDIIFDVLGFSPGIWGGGEKNIGEITIAMVQTLERDKNFDYRNFDLLVCDEIHHYAAPCFYSVAMNCPAFYRLGMSATTKREDNAQLTFIGGMGQIIDTISVKELIKLGYLVQPRFEYIPVAEGGLKSWKYQETYKNGIVINDYRNNLIARRAKSLLADKKQVYIHVTQVAHGKRIQYMIPGSVFLSGKDSKKTRERVLEEFKTKKLNCLVSTLMGEGVDIPSVDAIIMASGGKSEVATIQRIGRVLRPAPGKNEAIVVDFIDQGKWLRDHAQQRMMTHKEVFG